MENLHYWCSCFDLWNRCFFDAIFITNLNLVTQKTLTNPHFNVTSKISLNFFTQFPFKKNSLTKFYFTVSTQKEHRTCKTHWMNCQYLRVHHFNFHFLQFNINEMKFSRENFLFSSRLSDFSWVQQFSFVYLKFVEIKTNLEWVNFSLIEQFT